MEFPVGAAPISGEMIKVLESNGCSCSDWSRIRTDPGLDPLRIRNVRFSGDNYIGRQSGIPESGNGSSEPSGITNAHIENCIIGHDVHISNISGKISSYIIENNVLIRGCGTIATTGKTTFGNGTEAKVLNEAGGRIVKIWDRLSSHMAYLMCVGRDNNNLSVVLSRMVEDYASGVESGMGVISAGSVITDCLTITNVRFGPSSVVKGALRLSEGSVNSTIAAPSVLGHGIVMDRFITASGSSVTDGCIIENCFIGQGCRLGKGFSAQDSLFFANSEALLGEACSIYAGPYTVTHHRSTLLIAGLFSFMNAGSGTNQSNHMYKSGPVHQGILERGTKTASDSYILWPALVGPFSLVSGRHYSHPDTSAFPFSYLIESKGESVLLPGANIKSSGLIRDIAKWPSRDRRKDPAVTDQLIINLHSPYTMGKMIKGKNVLDNLKDGGPVNGFYSLPGGVKIPEEALVKGLRLYTLDIEKYIANGLIRKLQGFEGTTVKELSEYLSAFGTDGCGEWTDTGGLLAPRRLIDSIVTNIISGRYSTPDEINREFAQIHSRYSELEWDWLVEKIEETTGISAGKITPEEIIALINKGMAGIEIIDRMIYEDAASEFSEWASVGYGAGGSDKQREDDFRNVRGSLDESAFLTELRDHSGRKRERTEAVIEKIARLKR